MMKKRTNNKRFTKQTVVYNRAVLSRIVKIFMNQVGSNVNEILQHKLREKYEGKCSVEGYIKPGSIQINDISSGLVAANQVEFNVIFECMVCFPVEGMVLECVAKNITKAGVRCNSTEEPSPLIVFISRDHHYSNDSFVNIKEDQIIYVKVIGQRFELNDTHISIIGELVTKQELHI